MNMHSAVDSLLNLNLLKGSADRSLMIKYKYAADMSGPAAYSSMLLCIRSAMKYTISSMLQPANSPMARVVEIWLPSSPAALVMSIPGSCT